jgi:hypothetical protein
MKKELQNANGKMQIGNLHFAICILPSQGDP